MSRSILLSTAFGAAVVATLWSSPAVRAESPTECAPGPVADRFRMLRQLSLDLYGRPPTVDEYEAVRGLTDIDDAKLTQMMASDEYFANVREYHRALLWGGLDPTFELVPGARALRRLAAGLPNTTADDLWREPNLNTVFRGRNNVECLDQPQVDFDAAGRPVPINTITDATCVGGTCVQEGYVMVRPYWDPNVQYKVCAFDAQALPTGVAANVTCNKLGGVNAAGAVVNDKGCGCGPELRNCLPEPTHPSQTAMRAAILEEPLRIFEQVVRSGQPYFDAFTTKTTFVNGPLRAFYTNLAGSDVPMRASTIGYDPKMSVMPTLAFTDTTWVPTVRSDVHAGVLTTPGYQLRLATNRARVNRFYTAFRCEPFLPPAGGLPADVGGIPEPNLRVRNGCGSCHATIEPAAAHWGRWRTSSTYGYIEPSQLNFEVAFPECKTCTNCSTFCRQYFVTPQTSTNPEELGAWRGYHTSRLYLNDEEARAIDLGPAGLVDDPAEQAKVASCAVRSLAENMFNRTLTDDEVLSWLPTMTSKFAESGYRFDQLTRMIVESPTYRTLR
jgi:hypothetical protein